jgi:O-antigen/teichoic acid export membrane protein
MGTANKIVKHGGIYFVGTALRQVVGLVMLPIYTRALTPADYGTLELLTTVIDFAGLLFGLQLGAAVFRFYSEYQEPSEKAEVISTSLILLALIGAVAMAAVWSLSGPIGVHLLGGPQYVRLLLLFSLTLVFQPLIEVPMVFIRAQQRPWLFVGLSLLSLVLQLSLNIYLVVHRQPGFRGLILSAVISAGTMAALQTGYCLRSTGLRFSLAKARQIIVFSYPMVLTGVLSYYYTFGDRYFLKVFGSLEDVGLYSLGYKFGFILWAIAVAPFNSIWDSERYNVLKKGHAKETFQRVFVAFATITTVVAAGLSVFAGDLLTVMSPPEYLSAARIVPLVALAYLLQAWTGYCNLGILVARRTGDISRGTVLAMLVITVGYVGLIPVFGPMGAAVATAVASAARLFYIHHRAKGYYDMELPWGNVGLLLAIAALTVVASTFAPGALIPSIAVHALAMLAFIAAIILLPILPPDLRRLARLLVTRPRMAVDEARRAGLMG